MVLVVGFLAQYLPGLVPRSMYILPLLRQRSLIILATTMVFNLLHDGKWKKRAMIAYVVLAAAFFAMSSVRVGLLTPTWYLDWLKWFPEAVLLSDAK
jgi:hypothetical protein